VAKNGGARSIGTEPSGLLDGVALDNPSSLTVARTSGDKEVKLTWDAEPQATGYTINRYDLPDDYVAALDATVILSTPAQTIPLLRIVSSLLSVLIPPMLPTCPLTSEA
jgi:hypothetical protein